MVGGRTVFGIALLAIALGGCAENRYIYQPAQQATATVGNLPAARYAVPPERPTGEVLIASSGLTQLPDVEARTPALFVRMIVTNNSDDATWTLDTQQQLPIVGGEKLAPAYANAYQYTNPPPQIPPPDKPLLHLYYPLPPHV